MTEETLSFLASCLGASLGSFIVVFVWIKWVLPRAIERNLDRLFGERREELRNRRR